MLFSAARPPLLEAQGTGKNTSCWAGAPHSGEFCTEKVLQFYMFVFEVGFFCLSLQVQRENPEADARICQGELCQEAVIPEVRLTCPRGSFSVYLFSNSTAPSGPKRVVCVHKKWFHTHTQELWGCWDGFTVFEKGFMCGCCLFVSGTSATLTTARLGLARAFPFNHSFPSGKMQ